MVSAIGKLSSMRGSSYASVLDGGLPLVTKYSDWFSTETMHWTAS